ncbi:MAG: primosomal protein N' [Succinivibrionaceae bacterium]|nr:primosomal protein N' [Succinivibrionaceae bacterium]
MENEVEAPASATPGESCVVEVALDRPLPHAYDYLLRHVRSDNLVGCRVAVTFGGSEGVGIIVAAKESPVPPGKRLLWASLLDDCPVIPPDLMATLRQGSAYYHHPLGQCLATALCTMLRHGAPAAYDTIPGLRLTGKEPSRPPRSQEQRELLALLRSGPLPRRVSRERGYTSQQEAALVKKGLVEIIDLQPGRHVQPMQDGDILREVPPDPSAEQREAVAAITADGAPRVFLLNGVTGSGKTEIYLRIIEHTLRQGRAALVLVPEIALTPQTFRRFYNRFSVPIASLHSQLSDRERLDAVLDMATGHAKILIGTRSALFCPIPRLGLIVIDEEHDLSFRQEDGFRYHARTLALLRAHEAGCQVVLGSATPSLEAFRLADSQGAVELTLRQRAGGASLPQCEIVDMRKEPLTAGLSCGIGETLERRVGEVTVRGHQALIFLNRRGYAHSLSCHHCGHVFMCPHCDNPLTVHRHPDILSCHICEHRERLPLRCPECQGEAFYETGFGTEQIEDFLKRRYPDLSIERIDRDTVKSKAELERRLDRIRSGESQILVGTQLLAKGHDFPNVTLVGIIDVDAGLFSGDYRALEQTAQLLTQVSGRAGRASESGEVLIETHHPDHPLLRDVTDPGVEYRAIAASLLDLRAEAGLPPFAHEALLLANSKIRERAFDFLSGLREALAGQAFSGVELAPVLPNRIERKGNRHYFNLRLSSPLGEPLHQALGFATAFAAGTPRQDLRFAVEVDPVSPC